MNLATLLYFTWDPSKGIEIGTFTLHYYSLMFVLAFGIGYYLFVKMFKIDHESEKSLDTIFTWTLIGTILGARLGHVIFYQPELFKQDFWSVFLPIQTVPEFKFTGFSGLASHGAAIVLVIGADVFSSITDWSRKDSVFFGDGAGAVLLSATNEDKGFIDFKLHADGTGKYHFNIPAGGCEIPASEETIKQGLHYFQMNGKEVFNTATKVLPEVIHEVLADNNLTANDIDWVIPHQPSVRILQKVAEEVNIPFEKVMTNMDKYANTSGGTIPIVLDETYKSGKIKEGNTLLFAAVGSGWTWGAALYKV